MPRAVWVEDGIRLIERPPAPLQLGEARVRVAAAALTGLDVEIATGATGFRGTPGHAFVGRVVEAEGPVARRLIGRRVIPAGSWGCGVCDACTAQLESRCVHRRVAGYLDADGGHAEEVVLPARVLQVIDDELTDEAAVMVPLVAAIYGAIERAAVPEWTNFLVVGDGGTGLLAAVALARAGYTVTVRGRHGDRFDLLRRYRINFNLVSDDNELSGLRPGRFGPALMSYPYVVEASGQASGWNAAAELVSPGGCLFMMSSALDGVPRPVRRIQEKSVRVMGLREGPVPAALRIVSEELLDPTVVISGVQPFDDVLRAYRAASLHRDWLTVLDLRS